VPGAALLLKVTLLSLSLSLSSLSLFSIQHLISSRERGIKNNSLKVEALKSCGRKREGKTRGKGEEK